VDTVDFFHFAGDNSSFRSRHERPKTLAAQDLVDAGAAEVEVLWRGRQCGVDIVICVASVASSGRAFAGASRCSTALLVHTAQ
jgi:hypothetical protein